MNHIKLSLIIPTYNRGKKLLRTLDSLTKQTLPMELWEVVVVNNNSTDDTLQVFDSFAVNHPQINARIVTEVRQGVSHARNRAIEESVGEYIVAVDDDEIVVESFLKDYFDFFEEYTNAAGAGGRILPEYESTPPKWISPYTARPIVGSVDFGEKVKPFPKGTFFGGGNMGFRRSAIEKYGMFDTSLGRKGNLLMGGEEKDLFMRMSGGGEQFYYLPTAVIYHLIEPERLTKKYFVDLCRLIGVSERVRTKSVSRVCYFKRVISEGIKWCGAFVLSLWYMLKMSPAKSKYLIIMRRCITLGLLTGRK